jgi:hypothetical protein
MRDRSADGERDSTKMAIERILFVLYEGAAAGDRMECKKMLQIDIFFGDAVAQRLLSQAFMRIRVWPQREGSGAFENCSKGHHWNQRSCAMWICPVDLQVPPKPRITSQSLQLLKEETSSQNAEKLQGCHH